MKRLFITFNLLLFIFQINAQYEAAHWFFGYHAGLDFTVGAPIPESGSQIDTEEGCASISNACGDLLLYTDGSTVWNANHQIMQNGTGLQGNKSSTQSGIVVPNPEHENIYYIFTVDRSSSSPSIHGLRYSVVDMNLDGGLGGIISGQKNIPLVNTASEKVTAVVSADDSSIWVVTLAPQTSSSSAPYATIGNNMNTFYVFKITGSGVQTTANVFTMPLNIYHGIGYMKASPNGKKMAIANTGDGTAYLFDFDSDTGSITNPVSLTLNFSNGHPYGLEFSPDSSKLYLGDRNSRLAQFDLDNNNQPILISTDRNYRSALQLGLDGKIYQPFTTGYREGSHYLSVIDNPNEVGTACNYRYKAISLPSTMTVHEGLPPFIQSYFLQIHAPNVTAAFTNKLEVESNQGIQSVEWDFGDGTTATTYPDNPPDNTHSEANHLYDSPGDYTVTAILHLVIGCDVTVTKTVVISDILPENFTNFCSDNTNGNESVDLHQFDQSIIDFHTNNSSTYEVRYYLNEQDALNNQNEITGLYNNTTNRDKLFYVVKDLTTNTFFYGTFYLSITPKPQVLPVNDFEICDNDNDGLAEFDLTSKIPEILGNRTNPPFEVKFYPTQPDAESGTNLITTPEAYINTTPVMQTIWYTITNTNTGCQNIDAFNLKVYPIIEINMDDTYKFCEGENIQIEAPSGFISYSWSTGETTQAITVSSPGDYTITVTNDKGCSNSKTIKVIVSDAPVIDDVEIKDFNADNHNSITIKVSGIGKYEYSIDGINFQDENVFTGLHPGTYTIYVSDKNGCGLTTKDIDILGAPNYFTPNGDGFNDTWQIINLVKKPYATVQIFNRYGKLLKTMGGSSNGWDGTVNGIPLPADDYWFVVIIKENNGNIRQVRGHFALKR